MNREKALFRLLLIVSFLSTFIPSFAQRSWTYDFSNGLKSVEGTAPPLRPLGEKGKFVEEKLPELGSSTRRTVYKFEANNGLQFDNKAAQGFLSRSFTVEIYFKLAQLDSWKRVLDFKNRKSDFGCYIHHGKLNFFNLATGEKAAVRPNDYVHYVYSRNVETGMIRMYVNGESKVEFKDVDKEGILDADQVLNFFYDDLIVNHEASAGSVALIRLYDEVMSPVLVRKSFKELAQKLPNRSATPTATAKPAAPAITAPIEDEVDDPADGLVSVTGKIYDTRNLDFLGDVDVIVRRANSDSIVAQTKAVNGQYRFRLKPLETYRITAALPGYQPKSVLVQPKAQGEVVRSLINLAPETFDKPIATVPFVQSKDSLITEARVRLDSVASFLQTRPDLKVNLEGHTDNVGDFEKNLLLSWQRVLIIKNYLIEKGIDPNRIDGKGYGPTRPAAHNNSEPARQVNRRVEVWAIPIKR
ncbi:OmpA family protein [Telluribacter sp. SYSU D00476]|uniref:OmpA family protein n=1 Tax=Telluribacter sp. SYSU D00476 TaxID=2811430 RepID=UPI001FF1FC99|nr:OmpA family protein [Telluribacter sp. SYSU D00476]